jgi:hypothetical protein
MKPFHRSALVYGCAIRLRSDDTITFLVNKIDGNVAI